MSSIIKHKVELKNVNEDTLKGAIDLLQAVGAKMGITITNRGGKLTDYWGNRVECPQSTIVINVDGNRFPIGIYVKNGSIEITGDFHGCHVSETQLGKAIQQLYTAQATRISLMRMGYRTNVVCEAQKIKVQGVTA